MSEYTNDEQYYEDYGDSQDEYYEDSYDETEEHYDGSEESYDESEGDYYDYDYEEETENAVGADHEGEYEYYREDSEGVLKIDEVSEDEYYDYYEEENAESEDEEEQIKNRDDSDVVDDYYEDGYGDYQEYESEPENIENIPHQEDLGLSTTSPPEESRHDLDLDLDEVSDDEDLTEGSSQGKNTIYNINIYGNNINIFGKICTARYKFNFGNISKSTACPVCLVPEQRLI